MIPGLERSPGEGKGYPLQYSGLENSMDCIVHGVTKGRTRLSDSHFHFSPSHQFQHLSPPVDLLFQDQPQFFVVFFFLNIILQKGNTFLCLSEFSKIYADPPHPALFSTNFPKDDFLFPLCVSSFYFPITTLPLNYHLDH